MKGGSPVHHEQIAIHANDHPLPLLLPRVFSFHEPQPLCPRLPPSILASLGCLLRLGALLLYFLEKIGCNVMIAEVSARPSSSRRGRRDQRRGRPFARQRGASHLSRQPSMQRTLRITTWLLDVTANERERASGTARRACRRIRSDPHLRRGLRGPISRSFPRSWHHYRARGRQPGFRRKGFEWRTFDRVPSCKIDFQGRGEHHESYAVLSPSQTAPLGSKCVGRCIQLPFCSSAARLYLYGLENI